MINEVKAMKKYIKPEIKKFFFSTTDIITTSGMEPYLKDSVSGRTAISYGEQKASIFKN